MTSPRELLSGAGLLLADEFFCIAHDDRTGRPRLHPRVLALGLAAALLGELELFGRITVHAGHIFVVRRDPPRDALAHSTLELLAAAPQHRQVRTWLAFVAETAADAVGRRLETAGLWRRHERRGLGRTRVTWAPVDASAVAWRGMRLAHELLSQQPLDNHDAVLAGLVAVTGLARQVLWQPEVRQPGLAHIGAEVRELPPPLYELLAHAEAAVGDTVLSPR